MKHPELFVVPAVLLAVIAPVGAFAVGLFDDGIPGHAELYVVSPAPDSNEMLGADSDQLPAVISARTPRPGSNTAMNLVVVTHGWIERTQWTTAMAVALKERTDTNEWLCATFEWRDLATTINPIDAAKYGRDEAGPLLAKKILQLSKDWTHIHIIAHSSGAWLADTAAEELIRKTKVRLHITFLDTYVPPFWDENKLGEFRNDPNVAYWADHYMTRDLTLGATQKKLTHAHNIDLTHVDPGINDHRFPIFWYNGTIIGKFAENRKYAGKDLFYHHDGLAYGFARSLEAGEENFRKSLSLPLNNDPVTLRKPEKKSWFHWLFR